SVKVLNRFHHRKALILVGAAGQAVVWLPLLALPLVFREDAPWLLIACAVAYVAMGHFAIPAWNSLITDLVDPDQRGAYFGQRADRRPVLRGVSPPRSPFHLPAIHGVVGRRHPRPVPHAQAVGPAGGPLRQQTRAEGDGTAGAISPDAVRPQHGVLLPDRSQLRRRGDLGGTVAGPAELRVRRRPS